MKKTILIIVMMVPFFCNAQQDEMFRKTGEVGLCPWNYLYIASGSTKVSKVHVKTGFGTYKPFMIYNYEPQSIMEAMSILDQEGWELMAQDLLVEANLSWTLYRRKEPIKIKFGGEDAGY